MPGPRIKDLRICIVGAVSALKEFDRAAIAASQAASSFSMVFVIPEKRPRMSWKQRKAAARARATVRKVGRDRRVGGLASATAYKAARVAHRLAPRRPFLVEIK